MDLGSQIGLDVIISVSSGIVGAIGAYVKLKSSIDVLSTKTDAQEREIHDIQDRKKEMNIALHKRIDDQNTIINEVQKEMNKGHNNFETAMAQMELRIVKEFQTSVKELIKEFKTN